jgi:hypothetical protein
MKKSLIFVFISIVFFACAGITLTGCISSLATAAYNGKTETVREMLNDKNVDINEIYACSMTSPTMGYTPLMCAVEKGNIEIVKLLIENGADVNIKSGRGTALHIAVEYGYPDIVRLLLDKGAEVSIVGSPGPAADSPQGTPLQIARAKGQTVLVSMLTKAEEMQSSKYENEAYPVKSEMPVSESVKSDVDEIPSLKTAPNKIAFAIVIGIENYRQKLPKADYASQDARLVADYLIKAMGYPEENVVILLNDRAAKSDFEKYFEKWLGNNVENNSTVFVYYSGHGAPDPKTGGAYLVPYDGDPSFIAETGYSLKRMYDALGKLPAKEIIVALDSCFSGAGGRSVLAKGARPLVMNLQNNTILSKNMTVLSASAGNQISSTYDDKGHGLFTYFLLKGIKNEDVVNPDGSIKMDDLFGYIKPQVERIARKQYNNEQTPQLIPPGK